MNRAAERSVEKKRTEKENGFLRFVAKLLVATGCTAVLFGAVLSLTVITSGSMDGTLKTGDLVLGCRLATLFSEPERGDVIAFKYPVDEKIIAVKRIIGLPGETVEIRNGKIYVDGSSKPLEEPYLENGWTKDCDGYSFKVPEDSYFMLGDNRDVSLDSRYWAEEALKEGLTDDPSAAEAYRFVPRGNVRTKLIFRLFPLTVFGFF